MRVQAAVAYACVSLALCSACSPNEDIPSKVVDRSDYGAAWPLTVDRAVLACEAVPTVTIAGHTYSLEKVETPRDVEFGLRKVWANDPDLGPGHKIDLTIFRRDALTLC